MELLKLKSETGLELIVTTDNIEDYSVISGGLDSSPNWEEYLSDYSNEFKGHLVLIKQAIEKLGWVGETAEHRANETLFYFSDNIVLGFSWRAWGDLMSAIVGKNEGYMAYYM